MKNLVLVLSALLMVPAVANAERFILKNPQGPMMAKTIQTLTFGNDTYVVVEAPKVSPLMASLAATSESVTEDLQIGIPAEQPGELASKAWHVDAMKYADLPVVRDGREVTVAVLDTGVDYKHPALANNIFVNKNEIAGNGIDDDGNGFIDDVNGYDFDSKDADPMDGDAHGTHCAGIIGASKNLDSNAQGVAPGVKIMPVRIIGDETRGFLSNAAAGIKYAVDNGAKVLSNSWRVYKSWGTFDPSDTNLQLLRAAIEYAGQKGVIFVAASGNESVNMDTGLSRDPMFPGGFDGLSNMVVVAASQLGGEMAYFSNYGASHVTVAAPGKDIISTVPNGGWRSMSGTSMATPLIAGSIARGLSGGYSWQLAIDKLVSTSTQQPSWSSRVKAGGVVDLTRYLAD